MTCRIVPVLLLVAAGAGAGTDDAQLTWEGSLTASYAAAGPLKGAGARATVLRAVARYLAVGASVDFAQVGSSGNSASGSSYDYQLASTLVGGTIQVRLPLGPVTSFLELTAGYVAVSELRRSNTDCWYGSGPGLSLGAGASLPVGDRVALGLRGSLRTIGFGFNCLLVYGPWGFESSATPFTLGALGSLRW